MCFSLFLVVFNLPPHCSEIIYTLKKKNVSSLHLRHFASPGWNGVSMSCFNPLALSSKSLVCHIRGVQLPTPSPCLHAADDRVCDGGAWETGLFGALPPRPSSGALLTWAPDWSRYLHVCILCANPLPGLRQLFSRWLQSEGWKPWSCSGRCASWRGAAAEQPAQSEWHGLVENPEWCGWIPSRWAAAPLSPAALPCLPPGEPPASRSPPHLKGGCELGAEGIQRAEAARKA